MGIKTEQLNNNLKSFSLKNTKGMSVTILNYGAAIAGIEVPDRYGKIADVVLGHDNLLDFVGGRFYFGATVGRYANRIAKGQFCLEGKNYQLSVNRGSHFLHGGFAGFDKKIWESKIGGNVDPQLELFLTSPEGDEGFPGTMKIKVIYEVTENNELKVDYKAVTDKPTIINVTNHVYFNLTGSANNSILDHILRINADKFTPTDSTFIPTGILENLAGTPLDFRLPGRIGNRIEEKYEPLIIVGGYDHNYVLNDYNGKVRMAAELFEPNSGRHMELFTTEPGLQFYSGNYLDGKQKGKNGIYDSKRSALCLECQHFPNSPNVEDFPSVTLYPGDEYKQYTVYKFSVR